MWFIFPGCKRKLICRAVLFTTTPPAEGELVGCQGCSAVRTFQIRILRPLRVRFIVEKLSSAKMRSYSKTDLQQTLFYVSFMCVIKKTSRGRKIVIILRFIRKYLMKIL